MVRIGKCPTCGAWLQGNGKGYCRNRRHGCGGGRLSGLLITTAPDPIDIDGKKVAGRLQEVCRRFAGGLQEGCWRVAGVLQEACRRFAAGLQEGCWRVAGGLQEGCGRFAGGVTGVKSMLASLFLYSSLFSLASILHCFLRDQESPHSLPPEPLKVSLLHFHLL